MNIIQKLKLQQELGGVLLFHEGLFLRAYNESAYILTEILGHQLKIKYQPLKQRPNEWLILCAFPADKLSKRLPEAVITDFGSRLAGDFNTIDYLEWRARRCREESVANEAAKAGTEALKTHEQPAASRPAHAK